MEFDLFSEPRVAEFPTIIAEVDRILQILALETDVAEFDGLSHGWVSIDGSLEEKHVVWVSLELVHPIPRLVCEGIFCF